MTPSKDGHRNKMNRNIKTYQEFQDFVKYLADPSKQDERNQEYEKFSVLSIESQAKFITEKVAPFFNKIIELIQKSIEDKDETSLIVSTKKFLNYVQKIRKALPEEQREIVSDAISNNYNTSSSKIRKTIAHYEKAISEFNKCLFDFIIDSFENEQADLNISAFNKRLESADLRHSIKSSIGLVDDNEDLDDIFIISILSTLPSIKIETLGRIYAYVNCSWAKEDLCNTRTKLTKNANELKELVSDIQNRPDSKLTYSEIVKRNEKLLNKFTQRLNEICLSVKITKKPNQETIGVKHAQFSPHILGGCGEPDVFMQDAENIGRFVSLHCIANELLSFPIDQENDSNSISQASYIKQLTTNQKLSSLCSDLPIGIKDTTIEEIEVVIIAPSIIDGGDNGRIEGLDCLFKNNFFSRSEINLVSLYPLLQVWIGHEDSTSNLDILNIDKYLIVGLEQDSWKNMINKINHDNLVIKSKFKDFSNNFLTHYLEEACYLIKAHELIENASYNQSVNGDNKHQLQFIQFLPKLIHHAITQYGSKGILTNSTKLKLEELSKFILDEYKKISNEKNRTLKNSLTLLQFEYDKLKKRNKKLPNKNF